ncbi:MAG: preprotein translocase subunit YajC [Bacteroidales bacterium]|nr:preprotein translocase subunit YajC [Bacteroidales bacterium]
MIDFILLQAKGQGGMGGSLLLILVVMLLFMWLMGGSQRKQAKKEAEFRKNMKKGDRVVFSGGIYGKVHEVGDTTVDVDIANGTVVTVEKNMVTPAPEPTATDSKEAKK